MLFVLFWLCFVLVMLWNCLEIGLTSHLSWSLSWVSWGSLVLFKTVLKCSKLSWYVLVVLLVGWCCVFLCYCPGFVLHLSSFCLVLVLFCLVLVYLVVILSCTVMFLSCFCPPPSAPPWAWDYWGALWAVMSMSSYVPVMSYSYLSVVLYILCIISWICLSLVFLLSYTPK